MNSLRKDALRESIENVRTALVGLDAESRNQQAQALGQFEEALGYADLVVARTDEELISDSAYQQIQSLLSEISGNPPAVAVSPPGYHDRLMQVLIQLPPSLSRDVEQDGRKIAQQFRRSAARHQTQLEKEIAELKGEIAVMRTEASEAQGAIKSALDTKEDELNTKLEAVRQSADNAQSTIDEALERHETAFEEAERQRGESASKGWETTQTKITERADSAVEDLEEMRDDARSLVGQIGEAGTANHFARRAQREERSYWALLTLTVVAFGSAVGIAGNAAHLYDPNSVAQDTVWMLARLGISLALIALGTYTSVRSHDHRQTAKQLRVRELEMRAFGPFIEPLPEKMQRQERALMVRRAFGNNSHIDQVDVAADAGVEDD